ncbi:hypothetical protein N658DRAFT_429985 [Parathielavia hyrcaniae]|uniref:VWFA domain-containing protein n=1 Tax=Parathielavia hyrcaniae TaxID=113614 RepID=A0AAN6SZE6_9PEZI|nr:hypothetical protein N658DRAFT_429985 [Parathielavia hyrcaniae]
MGDSGSPETSLELPIPPKEQSKAPLIHIYPSAGEDDLGGVIIKVQPPREPKDTNLHHVPCDLVLSIDVSGSMRAAATVPSQPGDQEQEETGLSVLDLAKHAARTIMETLDANDRLGIVTFAGRSEVLQPLIHMTAENKAETIKIIEDIAACDVTNLWHGIRDGLDLFKERDDAVSAPRVPALLVLTDGVPNHMCPAQGYVSKLRSMGPLPATIHTFGFGYSLRSGLLKSIAEVGGGNYSFIPDAGMIGTVFVHAVANLQSTFANNAKLRLTYPSHLKLEETTGEAVDKQEPVQLEEEDVPEPLTSLTIHLSNLQYGQSRDISLRYGSPIKPGIAETENSPPLFITAVLECQHFTPTVYRATAHKSPLMPASPSLDPAEIAYHISRARLIAFLSTLCPLNETLEHEPLQQIPPDLPQSLQTLVATLPATKFRTSHPGCRSLLTDLVGNLPTTTTTTITDQTQTQTRPQSNLSDPSTWTGQVALALLNESYYHRWGAHYLPSLAGAHARQVCNSFKDAGPLRYGTSSPLFAACRDRLDAAFDALPAPRPSLWRRGEGDLVSMSRYNNVDNGCFAGCMPVRLLAGGGQGGEGSEMMVRVGRLRKGMVVETPRGGRRVVAVLRMPVRRAEMCVVADGGGKGKGGGLLVTPWHPVLRRQGGPWVFPKDVAAQSVRYTGSVYSVLLEKDDDPDAHAIFVGGVWGVTMGHGLTQQVQGDVRAHQFYGNYEKVKRALSRLPKKLGGVVLGGGLTRDLETGLVDGFRGMDIGQAGTLKLGQRKGVA